MNSVKSQTGSPTNTAIKFSVTTDVLTTLKSSIRSLHTTQTLKPQAKILFVPQKKLNQLLTSITNLPIMRTEFRRKFSINIWLKALWKWYTKTSEKKSANNLLFQRWVTLLNATKPEICCLVFAECKQTILPRPPACQKATSMSTWDRRRLSLILNTSLLHKRKHSPTHLTSDECRLSSSILFNYTHLLVLYLWQVKKPLQDLPSCYKINDRSLRTFWRWQAFTRKSSVMFTKHCGAFLFIWMSRSLITFSSKMLIRRKQFAASKKILFNNQDFFWQACEIVQACALFLNAFIRPKERLVNLRILSNSLTITDHVESNLFTTSSSRPSS